MDRKEIDVNLKTIFFIVFLNNVFFLFIRFNVISNKLLNRILKQVIFFLMGFQIAFFFVYMTALHLAVQSGHINVIDVLLGFKGIDLDVVDNILT